jgi:hypothetical protein
VKHDGGDEGDEVLMPAFVFLLLLQSKVRHVIEEWQKRGVYTPQQIEDAGGHEFVCSGQVSCRCLGLRGSHEA